MITTTIPSVGMEFNSVDEAWQFWVEYGKKKLSLELERIISTKERKTTPLDHASLFVARRVIGCRTRDLILLRIRAETRTDCKESIALSPKNGKYVIHEFVKEHNRDLQLPQTKHMLTKRSHLLTSIF